MATPNFMFGDVTPGAAGGVVYNTSMTVVDALFSGVEELVYDEPVSPAEGEVFAVGDNAANEFADQDDKIAVRLSSSWLFNDVAPGYATINKDNQCWIERGQTNWSHTAGIPSFYGRNNSAMTINFSDWRSVFPVSVTANVDEVFDTSNLSGNTGYVDIETDEAGIFLFLFSGEVAVTAGTDTVIEVGLGIGTDTPENGSIRSVFLDAGNGIDFANFSTMYLGTIGSGSNCYFSIRRASGSATVTLTDERCSMCILKLRLS
ncbi:MAG: hypothetical protein CMJ75_18700 [Planctomycetaceae bacterium]|nr:hypothetical protein [Planctomycetaceae bacterium]